MLLSRSLKAGILACALLTGGCDRQSEGGAQPQGEEGQAAEPASGVLDRSQAGSPLPAITVSDAEGETLQLSALKGTPVLVNLWATWCAPCVVELPQLDQIAGEMEGRLRIVTVSQDMSDTGKVAPFLREHGTGRLEPWLDPESEMSFALGANTLPATILYDAQGQEIWRYLGGRDWTSAESAEMLDEAFAGN